MIKLYDKGVFLAHGTELCESIEELKQKTGMETTAEKAAKGTIAYSIIKAHNKSDDMRKLKLRFDSLTSHDIT